ncbi:RagB/SusD family nutrient uptake outer membrane protein [Flavobacterium sp.]|uniref:RagB/SusD family nutrient uptake outer membrane protein n=1 Tax=Flavobacterium sp. TaxID=239 RepID=UPI002CDCB420|nr:RagB/SusD family nutrient uptake outer membrane protein [Flavobacterium sp.]HSD06892.1 RagB/SusD family nutrient uptake outer membrane protein [Flavobacterium sp.]
MKKIYLILTASFIYFSSCSDLTTEPIGQIPLEDALETPTIAAAAAWVNDSYVMLSNTLNLMSEWDWNAGLVFQNDYILQDIASDDLEKKWAPDGDQVWMDDINNFTFTASNGGPNGLWKYDYEGIKRANIGLETLKNLPDSAEKTRLMGEAYFLRAYFYFSLVTNFGGVPLILSPIKSYQQAFEVAERAEAPLVWDQIVKDLNAAKDLLPNSKYSSDSEKWRASKGAVIALLAKTALYNKKWSEVGPLVDQLTALGFSLNTNYFDSFNYTKEFAENEVIFQFDHQRGKQPRKGNGLCAVASWGFFAPSTDFLNAFEPNDPRKKLTVDVTKQNANKIYGSLDGTNKADDDAPSNKVYIRYGDALLWKAEALIELGDLPGAIAIINQIRTRARNTPTADGSVTPAGTLPDRPASSDKTTVKNWLISERRVELGFENQRMLDLKRWGIAKEVMIAHGKNFQDKHMLYPIPQTEVDASAGLLKQNPGY